MSFETFFSLYFHPNQTYLIAQSILLNDLGPQIYLVRDNVAVALRSETQKYSRSQKTVESQDRGNPPYKESVS